MNIRIRLILLSTLLTAAAFLPVSAALEFISLPGVSPRLLASRCERGLAYFFMVTSVCIFFLRRFFPAAMAHVMPEDDAKTENLRPSARSSWFEWICVFLPSIPLLAHTAVFSFQAYDSLYLGDQDFTNISSAINNSARMQGLMDTPFVDTGADGSFLGHHFSPALLLYVPVYAAANAGLFTQTLSTHFIYAICLAATLAAGLALWSVLLMEVLPDRISAMNAMTVIVISFPVWRLAQSFHFESAVIPLSALTFLFLNRKKYFLFGLSMLIWALLKEDMAVYLAFFGLSLLSERFLLQGAENSRWKIGFAVSAGSAAVFIGSMLMRKYFSGTGGPDWSGYWNSSRSLFDTSPYIGLFLVYAFLPAVSWRLFLFTILPVCLIHFFSSHPWHAVYYGHYGYSIVPFLLLGFVQGYRSLIGKLDAMKFNRGRAGRLMAASAMIGAAFYTAAGEQESPAQTMRRDERFLPVEQILSELPAGSCLQTQIPFTAHAPLSVRIFPLMIPQDNPWYFRMPHPNRIPMDWDRQVCSEFFLLLDSADARLPTYGLEHIRAFENFARQRLRIRSRRGNITLYSD